MSWLGLTLIVAFGLLGLVDFALRNFRHALVEAEVALFFVLVAICGGLA